MLHHKTYSRENVRAIDQFIISKGVPGYELMQRAATAAMESLLIEWPHVKNVTIFCGLGNNAGDGYVLAKLLQQKAIKISVIQIGDSALFKGDALSAYNDSLKNGIKPTAWQKDKNYGGQVIVDALLGTGLNSVLRGDFLDAVNYINAQKQPVLSIDIPSGLDANTGMPLGAAVEADVTVTFIAYKTGLFTEGANKYCGQIFLADLGIDPTEYSKIEAGR